MRRFHAHQFDAHRRMGNVRAGDIPQAGHLHFVPHQRCTVFRHNHHHHLASGFLQLVKEGIQLVEQFLRPRLIVGALVRTDKTVAVMQRNDVEEGGAAGIAGLLLLAQPAGEQFQIVVNRFAVKRRQFIADTGLRHQRGLYIPLFTQLFEEVAEHAGVIEHQLFFEAQLGQIIKQIALLIHRLIQVVV
ncbi:hypothetical protein D3C80_1134580 [compost metagenome]